MKLVILCLLHEQEHLLWITCCLPGSPLKWVLLVSILYRENWGPERNDLHKVTPVPELGFEPRLFGSSACTANPAPTLHFQVTTSNFPPPHIAPALGCAQGHKL